MCYYSLEKIPHNTPKIVNGLFRLKRVGKFIWLGLMRIFLFSTVLHLIKSTKDKSSLDIILDGKKKQTYTFASPHARESFCMQIRQMKNMFSAESEIDQLSVFVGTWNMGKFLVIYNKTYVKGPLKSRQYKGLSNKW